MPSVFLTLHQVSKVLLSDDGAAYQLASVVESAVGIDKSVFVFRTSTSAFSHYATSADLVALPSSQEAAQAAGSPFYRQSQLTRTWPTLKAMDDDLTLTRVRLRALAHDVSDAQRSAVVDEIITIEAG